MKSAIFLAALPAVILANGIWIKNPVEGGDAYWRIKHTNTIKWGADGHDNPEAFSVYLKNDNPNVDGNNLGIANNVKTTDGSTKIEKLPDYVKPSDGWRIEFVQVDDINNVYTSSSDFNIREKDAPRPPAQEGSDHDEIDEDNIEESNNDDDKSNKDDDKSKTEDEDASRTSKSYVSSGTASVMNMPSSSSSKSSSSTSHSIPNPTHNAPSSSADPDSQAANDEDSSATTAAVSSLLLATLSLAIATTVF
ncbi:hypothetical protein E3P92_00548 [Wallemia ichthyophaga]|uniref:Yeast cell wall synthesis Kre9/Knh1-like N-terminal domain-containing protein n=2 Tax=Wallemia ichthyophaga TaxID=245174 RepID=A0A4T0GMG1_WALIC|nr:uncharacterized protein J056_004343 [Wallemia ichthyophaga EXF-994]TIA70546.1 hypothetical protein E3P91_03028 [Wallemia ichthyophaga]EOR01557.1 hypothetical protein J056_004343 [Wallemia ichthyophaga EXF-994]TIA79847.1 hypothetical protein E3P98_03021 [Wallemia ichthyophaga]TIA94288.1 hypothetical protein E3P97_00288 [Wallemia ichthyophaga]TIB03468.1 hypothetical protein E3P95_00517 [Wallemia ichthyophaga]